MQMAVSINLEDPTRLGGVRNILTALQRYACSFSGMAFFPSDRHRLPQKYLILHGVLSSRCACVSAFACILCEMAYRAYVFPLCIKYIRPFWGRATPQPFLCIRMDVGVSAWKVCPQLFCVRLQLGLMCSSSD